MTDFPPLSVEVITCRGAQSVSRRVIDYSNANDRRWLRRNEAWALANNHSVTMHTLK